jgi:AAA domain
MSPQGFSSIPMPEAKVAAAGIKADWLWTGYIARGNLTLLTSLWKAGKTTMIAGLLQQLAADSMFLGRACRATKAMVVSEESPTAWATRLALIPIGPHVQLMTRPFLRRPTPQCWERLIDHAGELRAAGELDFLVVDPLAAFLPGRSESDVGTLLDMLQPLQRLAAAGAAVLILHHPRKERSEEGDTARGSGALLGFVDIILELHRFGNLVSDQRRRKLIGLSRYCDTPHRVNFEWNPTNGIFSLLDDINERRFLDNWDKVRAILKRRTVAATHHELLADWPSDQPAPTASILYEWLNRATDKKLVRRAGQGRRLDPYRYRLPNTDDEYYDRGELPPLPELGPLFANRD